MKIRACYRFIRLCAAARKPASQGSGFHNGLIGLALVAALAGCASVPPLKRVLLSPPQSERAVAHTSQWEVRRVQVPEYLDSYDIEVRTSNFVLSRLPNAKWAERLPVAITRLLQQTIDEKLQADRDKPYKVVVTISTFEPQASGQVVLSANWKVTNRRTHELIARDNALIRQPLPASWRDPSTIGRSMSAAVRELGYQIVSAIAAPARDQTPEMHAKDSR